METLTRKIVVSGYDDYAAIEIQKQDEIQLQINKPFLCLWKDRIPKYRTFKAEVTYIGNREIKVKDLSDSTEFVTEVEELLTELIPDS